MTQTCQINSSILSQLQATMSVNGCATPIGVENHWSEHDKQGDRQAASF
jgi:hypothetical protein